MEKLGIYIHIPFCKQKCKYCDFVSFNHNEEIQKKYINSLIKEVENKKFSFLNDNSKSYEKKEQNLEEKNHNTENIQNYYNFKNRKITTIYIGGGTPSLIDSKYISQILGIIRKNFAIEENAEITIEINPGTITKEKLIDYKQSGINRISIGLQTTNNRLLSFIGKDYENLYTQDLICHGVPSPKVWRKYTEYMERNENSKFKNVV